MAKHPLVEQIVHEVSKHTWYNVAAVLSTVPDSWSREEHPHAVMQDIIDSVFLLFEAPVSMKVVFHIPGRDVHYRVRCKDVVNVEFLFFRCEKRHVEQWLDALRGFLLPVPERIPSRVLDHTEDIEGVKTLRDVYAKRIPRTKCSTLARVPVASEASVITAALNRTGLHNNHFSIETVGLVAERSVAAAVADYPFLQNASEICLQFQTHIPSRFARCKGMVASHLSERAYIETMLTRIRRLFGIKIVPSQPGDIPFRVLSNYWKPVQIRHNTPSFQNARSEIAGYYGQLYFRDISDTGIALLALCAELHAGPSLSCGSGYCTVSSEPVPFFTTRLTDPGLFSATLRDIIEKNGHARQSIAGSEGMGGGEESFIGQLIADVAVGAYKPAPLRAIEILGKNGKKRIIETLPLRELLLQTVLLRILHKPLERSLHECIIGFREGMSREKAIEVVRRAGAQGFRWVAESDIADFFPSIQHDILKARLTQLLPIADSQIVNLVMQSVTAPYTLNGSLCERRAGIPQGSPLSPLLANLYCIPLDEIITADAALRYVRYGDDFLVLARTKQIAEAALKKAQSVLAEIGLSLKTEKTRIKELSDGIDFLGYRFDNGTKRDSEPVNPFKKTLYIAQPYMFLGVNGEAVEVSNGKNIEAVVPLRRLGGVMCLEPASFSSEFLKRCAESHVDIALTLGSGYSVFPAAPQQRFVYERLQRHAERTLSMSEADTLCIARNLVAAKLHNYSRLFEQYHAKGNGRVISELGKSIGRLECTNTIDQIRGIEGAAARLCFSGLNNCITPPGFHITKRARDKQDPINSMLNFGYYLLFTRLNCLVRSAGLNPYLGILHSRDNRYESLVCDLQEPFRAIVDKTIITAVNIGIVGTGDFIPSKNGLYLTSEKRKNFLMHYQSTFERQPKNGALSIHDSLTAQLTTLRNWVDGKSYLSFFKWK